jgi:hypothetical protein
MFKSLCIACFALCFAGTLTAENSDHVFQIEGRNPLKSTAAIRTSKIRVKTYKNKEYQIAKYRDAKKLRSKKKLVVKTCLAHRSGDAVGVQTIKLGKKVLSESKRVHFEVVGKIEYVVHIHDRFKVFTSDKKQYIYFKN